MSKGGRKKIYIISLVVLLLIDRLTKYFAMHQLPQEGVFVLEKFGGLGFKLQENTGVAFGLPLPAVLAHILIAGILAVLLYMLVQKIMHGKVLSVFSLGLVVAGAFSNLYDRMAHGYVIDFINIFIWPTFNLADVMIVGGLAMWVLLERKKERRVSE